MKCIYCNEELKFIALGRNENSLGELEEHIEQYICPICDYIYDLTLETGEVDCYKNECEF